MILLTDYEALKTSYKYPSRADMNGKHCPLSYKRVAKAQLKKVVEWMNELCIEHSEGQLHPHRRCGKCLKALLDEVK